MKILCKVKDKKIYHEDCYYILGFVGNGYANVMAVCADPNGNLTWFDINDLVIIDKDFK